jgi:hypothetical protein
MNLILFGVVCGICMTVAFFIWEWIEERALRAYQRRKGAE